MSEMSRKDTAWKIASAHLGGEWCPACLRGEVGCTDALAAKIHGAINEATAAKESEIQRLRKAAFGLVTAAKVAVDVDSGEYCKPGAFDALQDHIDAMEDAL
jgi:hypothetical protein